MIKKLYLFSALLCLCYATAAQDFSNKGKDFWLCFPSHVPNQRNGVFFFAKMSLFITADAASSGTVSVPGAFSNSFSVTPGQVTEIAVPYNAAHILSSESGNVVKKGIRVLVDSGKSAVVIYSHIYAGFRSAASLILPVPALGKKYYSMNAPQLGIDNSKSQFVVVAVAANTVVKITPVKDGTPAPSFTISLPSAGDVYELQDDLDLSGTLIESIASGTDICKKIAVFSGSSAINIATNTDCFLDDSYDPLYQQLYPVNVWGKKYGFIPFENYTNGNPYRILASEDNTTIKVNGLSIALINAGQYYPGNAMFASNLLKEPVIIEADKPVSVAQYAQSSACSGATPVPGKGYGDADMVVLNPIEQNINGITVFSSQKENIYTGSKFINVLIPEKSTASFKINNIIPVAAWVAVKPAGSGFASAKIQLPANQNSFVLSADSSFNATAYGFGDFESYAYSAGTIVKDLYRVVSIKNEFGFASFPASCRNTPFQIYVTYPYLTSQLKWKFNGQFTDQVINNPVPVETFILNGKTVYRYKLDNQYKILKAGIYNFSVVAANPSPDGCAGEDEVEYSIEILDRPKADFKFLHSGCLTDKIIFEDSSDTMNRKASKWFWSFGDNVSSLEKSTVHKYSVADEYQVGHWLINDIGCASDTMIKLVSVTEIPVAKFNAVANGCQSASINFTDQSMIAGTGSMVKWDWSFGDNKILNNIAADTVRHTYNSGGLFSVGLQVVSNSGCSSAVYKRDLKINPKPVADFLIPVFCLPAAGQLLNKSVISDSSESLLKYTWNFGDGNAGNTSKDPYHRYSVLGSFSTFLKVISKDGCIDSVTKTVNTIYPLLHLQANILPANCLGDTTHLQVNTQSAEGEYFSAVMISKNPDSSFVIKNVLSGTSLLKENIIFLSAGDQLIRIVGKSKTSGCLSDTVTKIVHINKLPSTNFSIAYPLCEGMQIQFFDSSDANEGNVIQWNWDFANGKISSLQNPVSDFSKGTYNIKLFAETDSGCKAQAIVKTIKINILPHPDFDFPKVCLKDPLVQFINNSNIDDNTGNSLTYLWNFDDRYANASNPDISSKAAPAHLFSDTGNYMIRLTAISGNGCKADTIKNFIINGTKPVADFTVGDAGSLCSNKNVFIQNKSSVDFGSIIKVEVLWNNTEAGSIKAVDENPLMNERYNFRYPDRTGSDKVYSIKYIAYSGKSCADSISKFITVHPIPVIQFDNPGKVCTDGNPLDLSNKVREINQLQGTGKFEGEGITAAGLFDPENTGTDTKPVKYIFTTASGCVASASETIEVIPSPDVNAGSDKYIKEGESVTLNGDGNGLSFSWSPVINVDNASSKTPKVSPKNDITYTLTVTSSEACKASDDVIVKVIKKVLVPNAFTPNGDGINDRWVIPYIQYYKDAIVQVFNRNGSRIFYSKGYAVAWDGTYKEELLAPGNYVWTIRLTDTELLTGNLIIIR